MSVVGQQGVKYGLQAPAATQEGKPKKKVGMFAGSDDDEDAAAQDMNAAVRAQQGVKRADAQVRDTQAAVFRDSARCAQQEIRNPPVLRSATNTQSTSAPFGAGVNTCYAARRPP